MVGFSERLDWHTHRPEVELGSPKSSFRSMGGRKASWIRKRNRHPKSTGSRMIARRFRSEADPTGQPERVDLRGMDPNESISPGSPRLRDGGYPTKVIQIRRASEEYKSTGVYQYVSELLIPTPVRPGYFFTQSPPIGRRVGYPNGPASGRIGHRSSGDDRFDGHPGMPSHPMSPRHVPHGNPCPPHSPAGR